MAEEHISDKIRKAQESVEDRFNDLYTAEDMKAIIDLLRGGKAADAAPTQRQLLNKMFASYGVKCDRTMTPEDYERLLVENNVPNAFELPERFWKECYALYNAGVEPKDYMARIVESGVDPEFKDGASVRLKILKQLLYETDYLQHTHFYCEEAQRVVENEYGGSIAEIREDIFEKNMHERHFEPPHKDTEILILYFRDILYPAGAQDEELLAAVKKYAPDYPYGADAGKLLDYIGANSRAGSYEIYNASPELAEEIRAVLKARLAAKRKSVAQVMSTVRSCRKNDDPEGIIKAVLEGFGTSLKKEIKDCAPLWKLLSNASGAPRQPGELRDAIALFYEVCGRAEKKDMLAAAESLEELAGGYRRAFTDASAQYDKAKDNIRVSSSGKLSELLHICDDLAQGRFRENAEMKEILFIFAIAFRMTVFTGAPGEVRDENRDMEKNLFEDYYANNILRYLSGQYIRAGVFDEPTGVGINYRNFVEIVYLYWLRKPEDQYTPAQKLKNAVDMVAQIKKEYRSVCKKYAENAYEKQNGKKYLRAKAIAEKSLHESKFYRVNCFNRGEKARGTVMPAYELLSLNEKELIEFILLYYAVDPDRNYKSSDAFSLETVQTSATKLYTDYIEEAREYMEAEAAKAPDGEKKGEDPCRADFGLWFDKKETERIFGDDPDKAEFLRLLNIVDEKLRKVFDAPLPVTRSRLIAAYYYYYLIVTESDRERDGKPGVLRTRSFPEFRRDFCLDLNESLIQSSYQTVSPKNLLDMLIIYSAYLCAELS